MTVRELYEKLREFPPNLEVVMYDPEAFVQPTIRKVEQQREEWVIKEEGKSLEHKIKNVVVLS